MASKPKRKLFYDITARSLSLFFGLYCRTSWHGRENVPSEGSVILASNHASFFDPPLIGCSLPREICYLARESLFHFGPFGKIISALNSIPVDRDGGGAKGLKMIFSKLKEGAGILLFPEGTRTDTGELLEAEPGIGLTILKTDAPVIPVYISGSFDAFSKNDKFPKPKKISVHFGEQIDYNHMRSEFKKASASERKEFYLKAAQKSMSAIAEIKASLPDNT